MKREFIPPPANDPAYHITAAGDYRPVKSRLHASDEGRAIRESLRAEMKRRGLDEVKTGGCPECYGTGFRFGFGMPCSKGCTPRKPSKG